MGNVLQGGLADLATNPVFQLVHSEIEAGLALCKSTCPYWNYCGGGSPSNKFFEHGRFDVAETTTCRVHKQATIDVLMSKKLIRNLAAISLGTLILGGIVVIVGSGASAGVIAGILILIVCGITGCLSYFGALVKIARMRRMGWFMSVLFFGVLGALIYALAGPETKVSDQSMPSFLYQSYKQTKRTMGF